MHWTYTVAVVIDVDVDVVLRVKAINRLDVTLSIKHLIRKQK